MNNKKYNWVFYLALILLFANFIYRLIDQSKLIKYFPLDYNNDGSSYMAQLFFMKVCGFHSYCSYWYNGFTAFLHSPPGWYFFTLPILEIFGKVNIAMYLSILLILILSFFIIYFLYKKLNFSKTERIAMYIFLFGNAITVGNFIRLMRTHELFAWMNFLIFFFIIYYYKDNILDKRFILAALVWAVIFISYQSVGILSSLLFLSLFLVKKGKEKIYVILSGIFGLLLSAFWWIPFILRIGESSIISVHQGAWVWVFNKMNLYTNIISFILPLILIIFTIILIKNCTNKNKEIKFWAPVFILSLIFLLRLQPFLPVFGSIFPDPYLVFFLFISIFLFLCIIKKIKLKNYIFILVLIIIIFSVLFNFINTPQFVKPITNKDLEINNYLGIINGSFIIYGDISPTIYPKAVYSYAATDYNLTTPLGWYPHIKPLSYYKSVSALNEYIINNNCQNFSSGLNDYNINYIISDNIYCELIAKCSLTKISSGENSCLYTIN